MQTVHLQELTEYQNVFLELTQKMQVIGLTENIGLNIQMRKSAHQIEKDLAIYIKKAIPLIEEKLEQLQDGKYIVYIILILFFNLIFFIIVKPIDSSFLVFKSFFMNFKEVCIYYTTGGWFSLDTPVSSTDKTDLHLFDYPSCLSCAKERSSCGI